MYKKAIALLDNIMSDSSKDNNKIPSIMFIIIFIIELAAGYYLAVKNYENYNFSYNSGIVSRIIKILPLCVFLIYFYVYKMETYLDHIGSLYWYLFMIMDVFPMLIVYTLNGLADKKNILVFVYLITFIAIAGIYLVERFDIHFPRISLSEKTFLMFIILFSLVGYAFIIYKLGLPKSMKNAFEEIYNVRLNYRKSAGRFVDYFVQWLGNVINPFIFAYVLKKKKYRFAFIPFVLEGVLYIYSAYRSIFVTLLLAPVIAFIVTKGVRRRLLEILIALGVAAGVLAGFIGKLSIYVISVLRVFLWPPLIAMQYYDFFWMYPKMKLAHSIMSHFFRNVYNMEPSFYMGSVYYGMPEMRLNVNWYGDAYMNFGIIGVLVYALMLIFILVFIKSLKNKDKYLVVALIFGGIMALFNGPILTTLLTNGLGLGLLLAYLLPEKNNA